jgi:hypothetical protein
MVLLAVEAVIGEPVSARLPCFAGKYRQILAFEARNGDIAFLFTSKFNALPSNSLGIEAGNFAD